MLLRTDMMAPGTFASNTPLHTLSLHPPVFTNLVAIKASIWPVQSKHTVESDKMRVLLSSMTTLLRARLPQDGETSGNIWWVTSVLIQWLTIRKHLFMEHTFLFLDTDEQATATRCGGRTGREGMLEHGQMKGKRQTLRKTN
jgi:hypothetical protein